jgi:hypothetical protein
MKLLIPLAALCGSLALLFVGLSGEALTYL